MGGLPTMSSITGWRTVYMNPISRFIYWNMITMSNISRRSIPLPKLHELIRHDLPAPSPSIAAGFAEMWPALVRQLRSEDYFIRELPDTAAPYQRFSATQR